MEQTNASFIKTAVVWAAWIWLATSVSAPGQTSLLPSAPQTFPEVLTNAPPPGFATRLEYIKSFTSEKAILDAYHAGKIAKDEAMLALASLGDKVSMDTYGKVVDQNGQPITGVKVNAHLGSEFGGHSDKNTVTDAQGRFQYLGLNGSWLVMHFQKEGYYFDEQLLPERPQNYLPDPGNPLVITMWKQRGAEPMTHRELESRIPYDGTTAAFDLATGQKSTNGNLKITLLRSPLKIRRGVDKYDWNVKIEMTRGGLVAENAPYPYWAPESGYQSTFATGMSSNSVAWNRELKQGFYIKDGQGKYGRLLIDLFTDATRPDTGIEIQTWVNPSGSQNLEFDPAKQIR